MTLGRSTPLKIGAIVFAVFWAAWMIWSSGSFDRVNIIMFSISGAVVGFLWYLGRHALVLPTHADVPGRSSEVLTAVQQVYV